jgi:hypothetical protein
MCTFPECLLSAKTFRNKKLWWRHESERHRVQRCWICPPCELERRQSVFDTSKSFDEHFIDHHPVLTHLQVQNIKDMCQKDVGVRRPREVCPMCQEHIQCEKPKSVKALEHAVRKHVSRHLEQLAFFVAFPAGQMLVEDDDSEFQDDSDSEDGLRSEIKSIASKDTHLSKKEIQMDNMKRFMRDQMMSAQHATLIHVSGAPLNYTEKDDAPGQNLEVDERSTEPTFPILILGHAPAEHFYSRHGLLPKADKALSSLGTICLFHGPGGMGKTLAAVQYIYEYKHKYDAVFWLQADTAPGLAESYLQMVMALGIASATEDHHHVIDKGRNWLQETGLNPHVIPLQSIN